MKARIKKTGEIVNVAEYAKITLEQCDSWGTPVELSPDEVELIDESEQRIETPISDILKAAAIREARFKILLAVAPAVIDPKHVVNEPRVAFDACDIADAIFEEWSKREAKRKASGASK